MWLGGRRQCSRTGDAGGRVRRGGGRPELVEPGGSGRWDAGEEVTSVVWFARRRPVQVMEDEEIEEDGSEGVKMKRLKKTEIKMKKKYCFVGGE
ncbi:hypothetical protein RJT34_01579 [Clitoria ternatea]|uniref:Uncharacterized protein n=1 Tax=Clitoria ternatea TaxID=43366 RepID=A0AAN9KJJ9_CLITE